MLAILKSDAETLVAKRLAEHNAAAAGARIGPGGQELLAAGNTAGLLNGSVLKLKAESGAADGAPAKYALLPVSNTTRRNADEVKLRVSLDGQTEALRVSQGAPLWTQAEAVDMIESVALGIVTCGPNSKGVNADGMKEGGDDVTLMPPVVPCVGMPLWRLVANGAEAVAESVSMEEASSRLNIVWVPWEKLMAREATTPADGPWPLNDWPDLSAVNARGLSAEAEAVLAVLSLWGAIATTEVPRVDTIAIFMAMLCGQMAEVAALTHIAGSPSGMALLAGALQDIATKLQAAPDEQQRLMQELERLTVQDFGPTGAPTTAQSLQRRAMGAGRRLRAAIICAETSPAPAVVAFGGGVAPGAARLCKRTMNVTREWFWLQHRLSKVLNCSGTSSAML